jgi:Na+/H+-dicarboxylate symporter/ABC-type amino acid transport substrate-binding protein
MVRPLVVGLSAGVAAGIFFGEWTRVLQPAADGFVKLLQMAVLPYLTVSLVSSIGALRLDDLRRLGGRAALVLLGLWSLALGCAFLMPITFPPTESGTFFSTTLVERAPPFDFVGLYIPANPFFALANNIVPAVVLFSIVVGVALIGVPRKDALLEVLAATVATLARVMKLVSRLMPYGLFAIAATTAGSLRIEQAGRLQVYLLVYAVLALLLALWVLPGLVAALTPIPMRAIFASNREALVTATVAGDLFIVLPLLVTASKELAGRFGAEARHAATVPDIIVPMSYNFPHSGKLLSVSFVLFAGWFADTPIALGDYPRLAMTSILTLFGGVTAAMPFLLDLFRVPGDTFQLFLASGVINSRFGTLVAAMHTISIALLGTCAVTGAVRWRAAAVTRYVAVTVVLIVAVIGGLHAAASGLLGHDRGSGDVLAAMRLHHRGDAVVLEAAGPLPQTPAAGGRLDAITARRTLRVGYLTNSLPFAFVNGSGELVGFDVELMHHLATDLGVRLEFVPVGHDALHPTDAALLLRDGHCDILIGGLTVTIARTRLVQLSTSYLSETLGFVVRDDRRGGFESWDAIRAMGPLTVAVPDVPYYVDKIRRRLPDARVHPVQDLEGLFGVGADAIALTAERGSAWTLRFPQYAVVVPGPKAIQVPLAYALPRAEPGLATVVNTWIDLKRGDGTIDELYQYWILGREAVPPSPRWSIIRDVLHWAR